MQKNVHTCEGLMIYYFYTMSIESRKSFINKMHLITSTIEILFNTLLCLLYDTNISAWIFIQVILHVSHCRQYINCVRLE